MKSLFRCPVCGGPLDREERVYRCADRHSYDIAKEGYTYLLPSDTAMTSPRRATPICCPPIRSTPPIPAMTRLCRQPAGISYPKSIICRS